MNGLAKTVLSCVLLSCGVFGISQLLSSQLSANTAQTISASADTDVRSGRPAVSFGSDLALRVGYDPGGDGEMRTLIKFYPADLQAGGVVNSAQLSLNLAGTTTSDNTMQITVYRIPNTWGEGITWNDHLALPIDGNQASSALIGTAFGWYTWDLTSMVQAWVNDLNRGTELAILLRGHTGPDSRRRAFWSKDCPDNDCQGNRPRLDIQFSAPTATSTLTHTPTATPTSTRTPTATPSPTPTPGANISISVEPALAPSQWVTMPTGSLITYTISIRNFDSQLSNVEVRADARIEAGGVDPRIVVVKSESVSNGGGVVGDEVIWPQITTLQPGQVISYTYAIESPPSNVVPTGRTLYFPGQYLLNDGAELTWTYSGGSGSARTRPLRNPPFFELAVPIISR